VDEDRARLTLAEARRRRRGAVLLAVAAAIPVAFVGWFFIWPLGAVLGRGLFEGGGIHLAPLTNVARDSRLRHLALFTLAQAAISTAVTMVVGVPLAGLLTRRRVPAARAVRALVIVPFVLPTIVVAAAFAALLGEGGPLAGWHLVPGPAAIVLAHVWFNLAVVVRVVGARWTNLDPRLTEVARVSGAGPWRAFVEATVPQLAEAIVSAAAIVFLFCVTSFGVVLVLGGPRYGTLETEIYRLTTQELALDRASALVVVQMIVVLLTLAVASGAARRGSGVGGGGRLVAARDARTRFPNGWARGVAGVFLAVVVTFLLAPIAVVAGRSTSGGVGAYRSLGSQISVLSVSPASTIANSLRAAAVATVLAVVVGGLAAVVVVRVRRRGLGGALQLLLLLPLGVSAVTVGFGFIIALGRPIDLRASWWLVPIAQATVAVPFVLRTIIPALRSVDPRQRDAAALLGAPPHRVWREVDLPILRRALVAGATFAAAVSLGEFGATAFVARADAPTMPIAIERLLASPGPSLHRSAFALAVVLIAVTAAMAATADRLADARGGY
jgi:thiamine transport system permease protein